MAIQLVASHLSTQLSVPCPITGTCTGHPQESSTSTAAAATTLDERSADTVTSGTSGVIPPCIPSPTPFEGGLAQLLHESKHVASTNGATSPPGSSSKDGYSVMCIAGFENGFVYCIDAGIRHASGVCSALPQEPELLWALSACKEPVLSLCIDMNRGQGVVTSATNTVVIFRFSYKPVSCNCEGWDSLQRHIVWMLTNSHVRVQVAHSFSNEQ